MLTMSGICPLRSCPPERGLRVLLPWHSRGNKLLLELATRIGVDGVVDGLMGDVLAGVLGVHALEYAGNLLGRDQRHSSKYVTTAHKWDFAPGPGVPSALLAGWRDA